MRPLTMAVFTPRRRHSRSRFGQISVSIMRNSRGRTTSSVRRTIQGRVEREVEDAVGLGPDLARATCWPVTVVVERNRRRPGSAPCSSGDERRRASTSPTETAWIQIEGVAVEVERDRQEPSRWRRLPTYLPVPQRLPGEPRRGGDEGVRALQRL
jgi:hypothetical protein